jgi:hypothetical protein
LKLAKQPGVQQEYVRNLQQQIYLLELETRYLKAGKKGQTAPRGNLNYNPVSMSRGNLLRSAGNLNPSGLHSNNFDNDEDEEDELTVTMT